MSARDDKDGEVRCPVTGHICIGSHCGKNVCQMRFTATNAEHRPCTCHPDDNPPVPCPRKYALTECREAARSHALRTEPMQYLEGISDLPGLVEALGRQQQCDADGTLCQVSRQAVDEARTVLARMVAKQEEIWTGESAPSTTPLSEAERLSKKWLAAHPHAMMVVEHAGAMLRDALQPTASAASAIAPKWRFGYRWCDACGCKCQSSRCLKEDACGQILEGGTPQQPHFAAEAAAINQTLRAADGGKDTNG